MDFVVLKSIIFHRKKNKINYVSAVGHVDSNKA
jgi:hypothetical protein